MAIQQNILTRQETATVKKIDSGAEVETTVVAGVGTLALGKAGDIVTRAYGPVVRSAILTADADFGTFVEGLGILVNPNDCAAIGNRFETVKTLKAGQVGSFLVSGACIVPCSEVATIAASMRVQSLYGYVPTEAICEIEVNGFDDDQPSSQV